MEQKPIEVKITFYKHKVVVKFDEDLIREGNLHLRTKYGKIILAGHGYLFTVNPPNAWFPLGDEDMYRDDPVKLYADTLKQMIPDIKEKVNKASTRFTITLKEYFID